MGNQQLELNEVEIHGFEGKYSVTREGKVYNLKRKRYLKSKITRFGYEEVALSNQTNGIRNVKYISVHRLVAQAFLKNPDNLPQINHIDGNKLNNQAVNLEWCTPKHNIQHAQKLGLKKPSRPNLGKNKVNAKSKYRNVIYISDKNAFKAVMCRIKDGQRFVKTRLFSINKYGYEKAELLAAEAVNTFIDTYSAFGDVPKLQILKFNDHPRNRSTL